MKNKITAALVAPLVLGLAPSANAIYIVWGWNDWDTSSCGTVSWYMDAYFYDYSTGDEDVITGNGGIWHAKFKVEDSSFYSKEQGDQLLSFWTPWADWSDSDSYTPSGVGGDYLESSFSSDLGGQDGGNTFVAYCS